VILCTVPHIVSCFMFIVFNFCRAVRNDIYRQPAESAAGSSAGIVFTHGPIFGFFAPQGRHVAPIKAKFGREERTLFCQIWQLYFNLPRWGRFQPNFRRTPSCKTIDGTQKRLRSKMMARTTSITMQNLVEIA